MAQNVQAATPTPGSPSAVDRLLARRTEFSAAFFVLAALLAVFPIYLLARRPYQVAIGPVFIWGALLAVVFLLAGVLNLNTEPEPTPAVLARRRLLLLVVGGVAGLATVVLIGLWLPLTGPYWAVLGKSLEAWRAEPWALLWPGLGLFGGLALMFVSLQLGRGQERTSATMRRLVYGYNAVLTSLLVLAVLALTNVLAYAAPFSRFFGYTYDWTKSGVNTMKPETRTFLRELKDPVRVYVLLPTGDPLAQNMQTLLDNARSVTDKLSWELVDPQPGESQLRALQLRDKYKLPDLLGVLVVAGTEPNTQHDFIKRNDLFAIGPDRADDSSYGFKGEAALMNALRYVIEGKALVYFTQGSGEPELTAFGRGRDGEEGLGVLRDRLTQRKSFEAKELRLGPSVKKVPADADAVVVVRPTQPMSAEAVRALTDYVRGSGKKKGRLMLLFDPVVQDQAGNKVLVRTGLEPLLAEYGVKLGDNHVLALGTRIPTRVQAFTNPASKNPVARAFYPHPLLRTAFTFDDARTVDPAGPGKYTVEKLVLVPFDQGVWAEKDMNKDPADLKEQLLADEARQAKVLSPTALSIAVTVTESSGAGMPRDPAHAGLFQDTPRMVVFGNARWVGNEALEGRGGQANLDLFRSCLSWLREKPSIGQSADDGGRRRELYELNVSRDTASRLTFLPLALMLLGVVGAGLGVWVVRRR